MSHLSLTCILFDITLSGTCGQRPYLTGKSSLLHDNPLFRMSKWSQVFSYPCLAASSGLAPLDFTFNSFESSFDINQSINQLSKCLISVSTDSKAHHPVRKA